MVSKKPRPCLIRRDLTPAQRAKLIAKRKAAYEAVHPETRNGGNRRGSVRQVGELKKDRFTADTAAKTGKPERSIQRDATRAKALGPDLDGVSRRRVPTVRKWNERPVRVFGVVVRGGGFARSVASATDFSTSAALASVRAAHSKWICMNKLPPEAIKFAAFSKRSIQTQGHDKISGPSRKR
ncbi:hypothetical protein ABIA85_006660 [Bradyrhizobium sp. LA6.10]|uniref:hypothetical protein n=1 Tax=Bradyrhizobium sp. LA6.10 TaxID=3156318 RepID=UPI0033974C31